LGFGVFGVIRVYLLILKHIMMKRKFYGKLRLRLFALLLITSCSLSSFAQQGLTLEQALGVAETNSPTMKKTRLSLIRSQENLNAQNASLKSQFSLLLTPLSYSQSRVFSDLISDYNSVKKTQTFGSFTIMQPIVLTDATISLTTIVSLRHSKKKVLTMISVLKLISQFLLITGPNCS
jgi:outer membrane protein